MGLLSRARALFVGRRRRLLERAAQKEALGRLEEATAQYLEAGAGNEAARVLALQADSAFDAEKRYALLGQASRVADGDVQKTLELRRAHLAVDLVRSGTLRLGKSELTALAERLGRVGDPSLAAEVFALIGDSEAEARMLVQAGAIEQLENVLDAEESRDRAERERVELAARVIDLSKAGRRREALELGEKCRKDDDRVADLLREVEARRVEGPRASIELDGAKLDVAFGDEVVVGRAGASVVVASPAVSREHLALRCTSAGPEAVDLGSRNGTLLRGARLDVPVAVGDGLVLALGGEVELPLAPWAHEVSGSSSATRSYMRRSDRSATSGWRIAPASDGWLELDATSPAFWPVPTCSGHCSSAGATRSATSRWSVRVRAAG